MNIHDVLIFQLLWSDHFNLKVLTLGNLETASGLTHVFLACFYLIEPSLYFGEPEYFVDESSGYVEVKVWRTGSDLSKTATITVRSRKSDPVSAEGKIAIPKESTAIGHNFTAPCSLMVPFLLGSRIRLCWY